MEDGEDEPYRSSSVSSRGMKCDRSGFRDLLLGLGLRALKGSSKLWSSK